MSDYPDAIDSFRATSNLPGMEYEEADETTIYSEDIQALAAAIVAIETVLGENPEGSSASVVARLATLALDSAVVKLTGDQTVGGIKTFSSPIIIPNGSAASPGLRTTTENGVGIFRAAANILGLAAGGVEVMRLGASIAAQVPFLANAGFWLASQKIGSTLNLNRSTTKGILIVDHADCTINLPRVATSFLPSVYYIYDPLGLLSTGSVGLTIHPYDDGFSEFNDINGADPVNGAWFDPSSFTTGPFGPDAILNSQFGLYMLVIGNSDTGNGSIGGWNIFKLSNLGY